jgi:hypothetical protein
LFLGREAFKGKRGKKEHEHRNKATVNKAQRDKKRKTRKNDAC